MPVTNPSDWPEFDPVSVIGKKGQPIRFVANGVEYNAVNIINKEVIRGTIYAFCDSVVNKLLQGKNATILAIANAGGVFSSDLFMRTYEPLHADLMYVPVRRRLGSKSIFVCEDAIVPRQITDQTVVISDVYFESGASMTEVYRIVRRLRPRRIITLSMIRKIKPQMSDQPNHQTVRHQNLELFEEYDDQLIKCPDYWLFEIHEKSKIFGYGIDLNQQFRHLPYVCDDRALYYPNGQPHYRDDVPPLSLLD